MRFQHGDVILVYMDALPKDAKKVEIGKKFVVEKGEGIHTHVIEDTKGLEVYYDSKGTLWMKPTIPKPLNHEEHGIKVMPVGICFKDIENEYDAEADEVRKTQD